MTPEREPIAVIGTGYVGLVTAAGFAHLGNEVWCVDVDADKIARLRRGEVPIYEPGLAESISEHRERLLSDLRRHRPDFVVDTAPSGLHGWDRYPLAGFPELEAFVHEGYAPAAVLDGVWVWRRKGCKAGAGP